MTLANPTSRRWTLAEYYQMADMGFFQDQRVELIDGEILDMAPQKDSHAISVSLAFRAISLVAGQNCWVRSQLPWHADDGNEPEPDISVVKGSPRDYLGKGHPMTAILVAEISDTSLKFDRTIKSSLYAKSNIQDFWIVNLIDRQVEVYRLSLADPSARFGFSYSEKTIYRSGQSIKPLAFNGQVAVDDLLP